MTEHVAIRDPKDLVVEAVGALARLDADRLEEIAEWCGSLSRGASGGAARPASSETGPEGLRCEMAALARILEATRVNMNVLRRVKEVRSSAIEYGHGKEILY